MIGSMKQHMIVAAGCAAFVFATGCEKKKTGTGGGGGAWVVGQHGLMANIKPGGLMGDGYDLASEHDLLDITCRGKDTAFVVGEVGTLLHTADGGVSWEVIDLATTRTLRSVAAQGANTIYVAGDQLLVTSPDSGTTWHAIEATKSWLSVAAGAHGTTALALDASGGVWRYDSVLASLTQVATVPSAHAVAFSHDGFHAAIIGAGHTLSRSDDGGLSWQAVERGAELDLKDAWITADGQIVAVGAAGTVARIDGAGLAHVSTPAGGTLRAIHIDAQGRGLAGGDAGEVVQTFDGGASWAHLTLPIDGTIFGVDDVDGDGHL
jgi:photosystem II stability/assembly factor-like uncharacterized protein